MKLREIVNLLNARVVCNNNRLDDEVEIVFASDLMSDVLTITNAENVLLLTGLANLQTIRTAEMLDITHVIFVRKKKVSDEMKELAKENNMALIECDYSMFKACGILYQAGLKALY